MFCSFCTYPIEILKVAEKCKIIKIKAPREVWGLGIKKNWQVARICPITQLTDIVFIPNNKLYKNTSKSNNFCITWSFGMVLISYCMI